jgi:4-diphosphocytidyl-2-C-methyl-D-erythritol kinase
MAGESLTLNAPAKINWFLKILGLRDDGYHEIRSLIQKVTLYDELRFTLSDRVIIKTNLDIPVEENLVYRAARLLKERYHVDKGIIIELKKNIPMGAGLGGGSSDAAATLVVLNRLWSLHIPEPELYRMASELGSDVPSFLKGGLTYVEGRGERVIQYEASRPLSLLLVKPHFEVSTRWAYTRFDEHRGDKLTKGLDNSDNIKLFVNCIRGADIEGISRFNHAILNDLEVVTLSAFPLIAEIKERLRREGAVFSLMSGSGSTVFGVFESWERAEEASRGFGDLWTAVVQTIIK